MRRILTYSAALIAGTLASASVFAQAPKPVQAAPAGADQDAKAPKALIITGDSVTAHNWKETTKALTE